MRTSWFTFGQSHEHVKGGIVFDKDTVVEMTADDPRDAMFKMFGPKWSMQYDSQPDMRLFPKGIIKIK